MLLVVLDKHCGFNQLVHLSSASFASGSEPVSRTRAGSRYMPLGHMLTFRIAYQIAAGLAYLHRKNIIFCDLKSDNILVWSLEVGVKHVY